MKSPSKKDPLKMKNMGNYLKQLRKDLGLTLREAAKRAEIAPSHLSKIETGLAFNSIGVRVLINLSKTYNIPITAILEEAGFIEKSKNEMPEFSQYLRSKYQLPPQAIRDMEMAKELVEKKYQR